MMTARIARSCKRPYIISAHGMLESWALRDKRFKKAIYAALVETRSLQRAACLRALTADEVDDYRRLGLTNPIAIIPNGVEVAPEANADLFWETHPQLRGKRIVVFLGRLHHKKGLPLLLQAWARVVPRAEDAHLVIAGPDSGNMLASLQRLAGDLKINSSVTFAGIVTGKAKWSLLAAAKLFVLPSYSEGFSMAVLEALAMGIPAIVTEPCHFPEVAIYECGWIIQPALDRLEYAFQEFLNMAPHEAARMGQRGRELVRRRFSWPVIGNQMAGVYGWLEGGAKPSNVEIV